MSLLSNRRSITASSSTLDTRLDDAPAAPIMSRDESRDVFDRVVRMTRGVGDTTVNISSTWRGNLRWANNEVITAGDTVDHMVTITRRVRGALSPFVTVNQLDDASLKRALDVLEYRLRYVDENPDAYPLIGAQHYVPVDVFFDATRALTAADRSRIGRELTQPVAATGLLAAGYLAVEAQAQSVWNTSGLAAYARSTQAQYSITVRNPSGTGSGWAGVDQNDWRRIDATQLTARAREKCVASADPRAVEPGRYTAVLEPQAVHDLMHVALNTLVLSRDAEEGSPGPYHKGPDQSKLGERLLDTRITITSDPQDPDASFVPFTYDGEPYHRTSWFTNGVLTQLGYDRRYAVESLARSGPQPASGAYRMSGGTTSIDEMITTTQRGVLVTRFSGMETLDGERLILTGVTRDGLWLIENGKITYAIKNFRFNESPLFVFNQVEQLGVPVRVFSPGTPAVVPPVKVRDFNFTSIADAV